LILVCVGGPHEGTEIREVGATTDLLAARAIVRLMCEGETRYPPWAAATPWVTIGPPYTPADEDFAEGVVDWMRNNDPQEYDKELRRGGADDPEGENDAW
jgi:hypothetical protein